MYLSKLKKEEGQTLVEFAIVVPLLLLIIFSIIEFGWFGYQMNLFNQGYMHASWDVTAAELNDLNPITAVGGTATYDGSLVEDLIRNAIKESSLWGFEEANLTVTNGKAVLTNTESTFAVPGRKSGEVINATTITRSMKLTATITYQIKPLIGFGEVFFGNSITMKKELDCVRVVGSQHRSE